MHSCESVWGKTVEYRYPPLVKSSLYSTSLLWKTYTVLIFANQKKSKEGFHSYKNKVRSENNMQCLLCKEPHGGRGTGAEWRCPGSVLGITAPRCHSPEAHLCCIETCCVHPELPHGSAGKNAPASQETQETWVQSLGGENPLQEEWKPTPVFLPGNSYAQRSLEGYSPQGSQRVEHDWVQRYTLCASIRKMCSKIIASSLTKGFIGELYFQVVGKTSILFVILFSLIIILSMEG